MRKAINKESKVLVASAQAPARALCPDCGCTVSLRRRRLMGGGVTYYWKHPNNVNSHCSRRARAAKE